MTFENPTGTITNSDLEMAGVLLLWLVMEAVVPSLRHEHVTLLSDKSPTIGWVDCMASKRSQVAGMLLRALSLRLRVHRVSPLTPLHIRGKHIRITDIPSCSFGYKAEWHCKCDHDFLTFFITLFHCQNRTLGISFTSRPKSVRE